MAELTASAHCLASGCTWPAPEGTPAAVDKAAEAHTTTAQHPTATVMTPDLPVPPVTAGTGSGGTQGGYLPGASPVRRPLPGSSLPGGGAGLSPSPGGGGPASPRTPAGGGPETSSAALAGQAWRDRAQAVKSAQAREKRSGRGRYPVRRPGAAYTPGAGRRMPPQPPGGAR